MKANHIYHGDALAVLQTLPGESVNCVITSPPYWGLRDYGEEGQLGLEPTFEEYINKLCNIFDEVKRVLKKEGACWVNLGDTYFSKTKGSGGTEKAQFGASKADGGQHFDAIKLNGGIDKSLCLIPARFSIEMTNRGWILRNTIIWHKPNCMPQSVKDRFTVDFEYLFFFVKSKRYWFEAQYEEASKTSGWARQRREGIDNITTAQT